MEYLYESTRTPIQWLSEQDLTASGITVTIPAEDRARPAKDVFALVEGICTSASLVGEAAGELKLRAGCDLLEKVIFRGAHPANRQYYISDYAQRALAEDRFWNSGVEAFHFFRSVPGQGPEFHAGLLSNLAHIGLVDRKTTAAGTSYRGTEDLKEIFRFFGAKYSKQYNN